MSGPENLAELISKFGGVTVLCIGDVMLDHFIYGTVERISPEAPIPVLKVSREVQMLGGAGNVARNVAALGANVNLVSVVGNDAAGKTILDLVGSEGNFQSSIVPVADRQTSLKIRHVASNQQMLRVDKETTIPVSDEIEDRLINSIRDQIPSAKIIILSDYAKGVLTPRVIEQTCTEARKHGKLVITDPKSHDFAKYRGVNVITPNAKELSAATGLPVNNDATAELAASQSMRASNFDAVLVTRSEQGMTLIQNRHAPKHFPAQAREVYDVSGAGDTVLATLTVALGAGATMESATALANIAAGIVVGKSGTAVVYPEELAQALHAQDIRSVEQKIRSAKAASDAVATWRSRGLKIGFTNGCFDLVHPGHISLLRQAKAQCDRLIVGLNTDASVRRLKGPARPVNVETARAIVLAALEHVDMVVLFDEDTPLELIKSVKPDVLIKGADYTVGQVVGGDFVIANGGRVFLAELTPEQSTTRIVEKLKSASSKGAG